MGIDRSLPKEVPNDYLSSKVAAIVVALAQSELTICATQESSEKETFAGKVIFSGAGPSLNNYERRCDFLAEVIQVGFIFDRSNLFEGLSIRKDPPINWFQSKFNHKVGTGQPIAEKLDGASG